MKDHFIRQLEVKGHTVTQKAAIAQPSQQTCVNKSHINRIKGRGLKGSFNENGANIVSNGDVTVEMQIGWRREFGMS